MMIDLAASPATAESVEFVLREDLARGNAALGTVAPILQHLLANDDNSVFGEEIVARARGMLGDVAGQLLDELAAARGETERSVHDNAAIAPLTDGFIANPAFLSHVHALALEWQLTERLQARLALDPVLPPLLQALISSQDAGTSGTAMRLLASQARFCQAQRRMKLPLGELPGDLLHSALVGMRTMAGTEVEADQCAAIAEAAIRTRYDEGRSRLGLIAALVIGMGAGAVAALSVTHAGCAIFLSALALASGQDRDLATYATNDSQLARLALTLRAAGLKPAAIEEQFLAFHPDIALPDGFDRLGPDRAAALLAAARIDGGH